MVYRSVCDKAQSICTYPFPVYHIFVHSSGLKFEFLAQVEDLECSLICFERNNLFGPMHKGTICLDRSPDDFIVILEIDDYHFRISISDLLANADVVIGFESLLACEQIRRMLRAADLLTQVLKPMDDGFGCVSFAQDVSRSPVEPRLHNEDITYIDSHLCQLRSECTG